ncbi:MAG: hypothetical protein C4326_01315 [Ignavibacteria bacterium]
MKRWLCLTLLVCAVPRTIAQPPPAHELRGIFLTTTNSLDWPPSFDTQEQQATLRTMLADMKRAHLNAVFFQVRARGDAYYRSRYEPWAENLTGKLGADPGWDPLQFLLEEAHAVGIEVHAWFNVYKIRGPVPPPASSPQHPARAFPQWVVQYDNELWLDPGLPPVRRYLIDVLSDLVDNYDLDAVCFDFIRYPGKDFPDADTYQRYGNGAPRDQWRRYNINAFVREAQAAVSRRKPHLKLGAAPLGNYGGPLSAQPFTRTTGGSVEDFLQDARAWVKNRWLDYLVPQVYWTIEFETQGPDFSHLVRSWRRAAEGRHIYVGIGAYKPEVAQQIPDQITASRMLGTEGQVFFRYEHVRSMRVFGDRYNSPAATPPMPWKRQRD